MDISPRPLSEREKLYDEISSLKMDVENLKHHLAATRADQDRASALIAQLRTENEELRKTLKKNAKLEAELDGVAIAFDTVLPDNYLFTRAYKK